MDTNDLRGLTLNIYRSTGPDCSLNGISSRCDKVTVVGIVTDRGGRGELRPFPKSSMVGVVPSDDAPAVVVVRRPFLGGTVFHVEPLDVPNRTAGTPWMAGGTYVATSDSRLFHLDREIPYGALSFHDRTETWAQYARLSD